MIYRVVIFFLLISCTNLPSKVDRRPGYSSTGFAFIDRNISSTPKDNYNFISHNNFRTGTKMKITNPDNNKSLEITIKKKIKYDNFYKILISPNIAEQLNLSFEFPFVEINEIKSNKSFIAKKAVTEKEEIKIANKAPIAVININNISQEKKIIQKKIKNYSILVAEFYSLSSAELLKDKLASILKDSNYRLIYISKKSEKKYELLLGPYNTINKLKNDYIVLDDSNFEDLDIKINE